MNIKIGIPKGLCYYYYSKLWQYFFDELNINVISSPKTNLEILNNGVKLATDEMCLSMKIYLGHVDYLKDKCDYILVPRIDRYDNENQTCTNFLALYDIVNNLFDINILNYNIDSNSDDLDGFIEMGKELNISKIKVIKAYQNALDRYQKYLNSKIREQKRILNRNTKKVLLVGHPYNIYDELLGKPIIAMLNKYDIDIIYSNLFDSNEANIKSKKLSKYLYWKFSKEVIGSIPLATNVDGIIFISSFPCGLDSLVNELVIRKIDKPYLNLILDDMSSLTGIETRIESFVDIFV